MGDRYEQEYNKLSRSKGLWNGGLPGTSLLYTGRTASGNQAQLDAINTLRNMKEQESEFAQLGGLQRLQQRKPETLQEAYERMVKQLGDESLTPEQRLHMFEALKYIQQQQNQDADPQQPTIYDMLREHENRR